MIRTGTLPQVAPSIAHLGAEGRIHLLSWAEMQIACNLPVNAETWRQAYGQAADCQTVVTMRRELAKADVR